MPRQSGTLAPVASSFLNQHLFFIINIVVRTASPEIIKLNMNTLKAEFKMAADTKPALLVLDPRVVLLAEIDFK